MTKVIIAGDWHYSTVWGRAVIQRAGKLGIKTIYHVGDFGFMGGGAPWRMEILAEECEKYGVTISVTPGNHENWLTLDELFREYEGAPAPIVENNTIYMLPRGYRWEHDGVSFVSLGGAPSIDRNFLVPNLDWFAGEAITYGDVLRVSEAGFADVMITHDAPVYPGRVHDIINNKPEDTREYWGPEVLDYCAQGHELLDTAYKAVTPRLHFHGHYHVRDDYTTPDGLQRIVSLEKECHRLNSVILDLDEVRNTQAGDLKIKPTEAYIR